MRARFDVLVLVCGLSSALACSSSDSGSGPGGKNGPDDFGNATGNGSGAGSGGSISADGVGQACDEEGATRECCGRGQQTCEGSFEFKQWGACLAGGEQITCSYDGDCSDSEFGQCDAGTTTPPPPGECDDSEFPGCNTDGGQPPPPSLGEDEAVNNEPEILAGYSPPLGEAVSEGGQIVVWVNDEWPEAIAPGEQVDATTGRILVPGDRTAKAPDGYLWEPALYIAPQTVEAGGPPHFPQFIKGWYNNAPTATKPMGGKNAPSLGAPGAPIDTAPAGVDLREKYTTQLVWNVDALGLGPGTYTGEFVISDGDLDRAIGCVTIHITP